MNKNFNKMGNKISGECEGYSHYPLGKIIGVNSNVPAYSCCSNCYKYGQQMSVILTKNEIGSIEDEYVGYRWQCVEYARRWLIFNKGVTFNSINCAYEIFDLENVRDIKTNKFYSFLGFKNGNNCPPEIGDLVIYPVSFASPFGHVAVVTGLNLELGFVEVSEQNYEKNSLWDDVSSYSRRVSINKINDNYILTEKKWVRHNLNIIDLSKEIKKVIGWKRVKMI